jgi:hypothetical protein
VKGRSLVPGEFGGSGGVWHWFRGSLVYSTQLNTRFARVTAKGTVEQL